MDCLDLKDLIANSVQSDLPAKTAIIVEDASWIDIVMSPCSGKRCVVQL